MRDITIPPQIIATAPTTSVRELEKSAVREAITNCLEGGAPLLQEWLTKIEEKNGPKAAFDSFIKLLEFGMPKLQRVTVQDPDGNAASMPLIQVNFSPSTPMKIVEVDGA